MERSSVIGVDLGGTKGLITRFDSRTFKEEESKRIATGPSRGFSDVLEEIIGVIESMRTPTTTGVGIGVPGLVKQPEGKLINAPNLRESIDVPLKKILEERLKVPVRIDNDANCFTLAEARVGGGKGKKVVIGITMGTGVGGGVVIDGKLFRGSHGYAGEIGHMLLSPGHPPYKTNDMRGEVEQFLSGTAWGKRCEQAHAPQDYMEGEVCSFMRPEIFREIAWLATSLTYLLDPDIIVFGGSAGHALEPHLETIRKEWKNWVVPETPLPELAIATLKNAATLGAALLAA